MTSRSIPGYLALFASSTTLVCCALPALFVLAGFGATVATVLSAAPWLVTLSHYKVWVFLLAALLLGFNACYVYGLAPRMVDRAAGCPPGQELCATASRHSRALLWTSALLFVVGLFVAYLLGPLLVWWTP